MSSEILESILTYVQVVKARHSGKIYAMACMMHTMEQMETVIAMIDSAMGQSKKLFAENLWEKCEVNEEVDVAELRALLRGAKDKAKETTATW